MNSTLVKNMNNSPNICNEPTFNEVYETHGKPVWRFIFFKCGNKAQADDLVQEAFVKLWQNCAKVPVEKARSFLFTVVNNAFLNETAHTKVVLKHAQLKTDRVENQSPQFLMEEKQFHEKLQNAIANLTETQRTAFLLNRIEGKKYKEIAEILDISVKAVEKRMSLALKSLRDTIGDI